MVYKPTNITGGPHPVDFVEISGDSDSDSMDEHG